MDVQKQIQQGIGQTSQLNRFNVGNTQRHIHNDVDAPYAFQPILNYVGIINLDVSSNATVAMLPKGWTVTHIANSGIFTITHNLNTLLYAVVVTPLFSGNTYEVANAVRSANSFTVRTFFYPAQLADQAFNFILTNPFNRLSKMPSYYGTLINKNANAT